MHNFIEKLSSDITKFSAFNWKKEENKDLLGKITTGEVKLAPETIFYLDRLNLVPHEIMTMADLVAQNGDDVPEATVSKAVKLATRLGCRLTADLDDYNGLETCAYDDEERELVEVYSLERFYGA